MPLNLQTALISAIVALITAATSGYFTYTQIQREKNKWLVELKTSYSLELFKTRLAEYPVIFKILGELSIHSAERLTPETAKEIGHKIHEWLYSPGGLCADSHTRGVLKALRYYCLKWQQGNRPSEISEWRHAALFYLRRDLDLVGFESFDPNDNEPLLKKYRAEMSSLQ